MKKELCILLFLTLSLTGFAQQGASLTINTEIATIFRVETPATNSTEYAKYKAKVLRINHKKSNEIISIKAYRKSLQIKVKTKKLC